MFIIHLEDCKRVDSNWKCEFWGFPGTFVPHSKGRTMADTNRHLSLAERETIMSMRDRRMPVSRIAAELRRHPATI